jgi:hypothetical protein
LLSRRFFHKTALKKSAAATASAVHQQMGLVVAIHLAQ